MFQGFYDLASNMITQNRIMNVISNNMANVSTPGFKSDRMLERTFKEELLYRYDSHGKTPVGTVSRMNVADQKVTNYEDGILRETGRALDVALTGKGFFVIQTENGNVYSRNGSFNLDNEGYLVQQGVGRVMGTNGPIRLNTDDIAIDSQGNITSADGFQYFGKIQVVDFEDYATLNKTAGGVFTADAQPQIVANPVMKHKCTEASNVSMVEEMTAMMSGQRVLQSSSQVLKMYDQLMGKAIQTGTL
jgi:flagellar basal-body rod protein FlgG